MKNGKRTDNPRKRNAESGNTGTGGSGSAGTGGSGSAGSGSADSPISGANASSIRIDEIESGTVGSDNGSDSGGSGSTATGGTGSGEPQGIESGGAGEGQTPEAGSESVVTFSVETPKKRGRPKGARAKVNLSTDSAPAGDQNTLAASTLLAMFSGLGVMIAGADAAIAPEESALIMQGLPPMLARMNKDSVDKINVIVNPLMVGVGLAMWGRRVVAIKRANDEAVRAEVPAPGRQAQAPAAPPPPSAPGVDVSITPAPESASAFNPMLNGAKTLFGGGE